MRTTIIPYWAVALILTVVLGLAILGYLARCGLLGS